MSSITIRNLDESIKTGLRLRAARHGWSMEQEVRTILQQTLAPELEAPLNFAERIQQRFAGLHVEDVSIPPRQSARPPPDLDAT